MQAILEEYLRRSIFAGLDEAPRNLGGRLAHFALDFHSMDDLQDKDTRDKAVSRLRSDIQDFKQLQSMNGVDVKWFSIETGRIDNCFRVQASVWMRE